MWTEERITLFRELWNSGISYAAIGVQLDITRSAVSGKADRLGLKRDRRGWKLTSQQRAARRGTRRAVPPPIKVEMISPVLPFLNLTYDELNEFRDTEPNQCRYIPGDDYRYCGQETLPGESWCASCKRIVYRQPGSFSDYHYRPGDVYRFRGVGR